MIIPPVQSKDYGDRDITYLWIAADQLMQQFSHIICIGYSFSALDSDMVSLLRRFKARSPLVSEVDFVSPDSNARDRFASLLGAKKVRSFKDLNSYLISKDKLVAN